MIRWNNCPKCHKGHMEFTGSSCDKDKLELTTTCTRCKYKHDKQYQLKELAEQGE